MSEVEALQIPLAINVAAVAVGALAGAIRAGEDERTDLVGMVTLATAVGFGGGILRDVLLGNLPPAVLRHPAYLIAVVAATAIGAGFLFYLTRLTKVIWLLDALGIGLFASVGTNAALLAGLSLLPAVMIGTLASVGGLMLADVLQGRAWSILYVGPPNAAAGMAGALTYALVYDESRQLLAPLLAILITFLVRLAGPVFHITIPQPRRHAYELEQRLRARARDGRQRSRLAGREHGRRVAQRRDDGDDAGNTSA